MVLQYINSRSILTALLLCFAIGQLPAQEERSTKLLNQLQQGSPDQRTAAVRKLAKMKSLRNDKTVISALLGILDGSDSLDRSRAAYLLGKLSRGDVAVAEKLIQSTFEGDSLLRKSAVEALLEIDAPQEVTIKMWSKMLQSNDYEHVMEVIHALADLGKRGVPRLRNALKHPEAAYWACLVAHEIGPDAGAAAPELVELADHGHHEVQLQAIIALGTVAGDAKIVVPALMHVLSNDTPMSSKYAACFALSHYHTPESLKVVQSTYDQSKDRELTIISGFSVLQLNPTDERREKILLSIIDALSSDNSHIRQLAVRAMAELKPSKDGPSPHIVSAMGKALEDSDPGVVAQVMDALVSKGKASVPIIAAALDDENLRHRAIELARRLGPDAAPAVPLLVQALKKNTSDAQLTREIHFALGAIGAHSDQCLETLKAGLASDADEIRYSACYAIGRLGKSAASLAPELKDRLESDDEFMRTAAAWTLIQIGELNEELAGKALGLLTKALDDNNEFIRAESARALGRLGKAASAAQAKLKKLTKDESRDVQLAAIEALRSIKGDE